MFVGCDQYAQNSQTSYRLAQQRHKPTIYGICAYQNQDMKIVQLNNKRSKTAKIYQYMGEILLVCYPMETKPPSQVNHAS